MITNILIGTTIFTLSFSAYLGIQLKEETKAHGMTIASLVQSEAVVAQIQESIIDMRIEQVIAEELSLKITNDFNEAKRDLSKMRTREATVLKRKSLVALKINKAFKKSQERLACITGDKRLCGNK